MQHTLPCPPLGHSDPAVHPTFNVVIAYEDFETGKHAKRTYDFLADTLGHDCRLTNQMWKFDVLGIPKLREMASADAAAADLVVISCHGDELPPHTRAWLESWASGRARPLALVALFDRPREESSRLNQVRRYLADVARRGNMEFFAHPDEPPGASRRQQSPLSQDTNPNPHSQRTLETVAGVIQRDLPVSRWNPID